MSEEILKNYKEIRMIENIKNAKNYLKQIKELEKENEELEKQIDLDAECIANYIGEVTKLKKENEELKAKYEEVANENLKEIYELIKKNDVWRGIVNVMNERLEKQVKTYKQALEEIREIVHNSPIVKTVGNAPMVYYSDYANKKNEIITKIDKVLR